MYYDEEAKERVQQDWENSYRSEEYTTEYKKEIIPDLVAWSFTDEEIELAIQKTGKKGLAWDCITV